MLLVYSNDLINSYTSVEFYGTGSEKMYIASFIYKNGSRLNRYNFGTVNAIDFLFQHFMHTTPFLCEKKNIYNVRYALGSNAPAYLSAGQFNSLRFWYVEGTCTY